MSQDILFLHANTDISEIKKYYLDPYGIDESRVFLTKLNGGTGRAKIKKKELLEELNNIFTIPGMEKFKYIVTDSSHHFKALTKQTKSEALIGLPQDSVLSDAKVFYVPTVGSLLYNPNKYQVYFDIGMKTVIESTEGTLQEIGEGVLENFYVPKTIKGIKKALDKLAKMDNVAIDIEAYSLKHVDAGLGTIAFSIAEHTSVAIKVDALEGGKRFHNHAVRKLLKEFFIKTKHKKHIYHNISYDATVLIYQLFMDHILDREGMLEGIDAILTNWDCTQVISYLAHNSTAKPDLSLKYQALEFAGVWAALVGDSIKDITKVKLDTLLRYNAIDTLSTRYVFNKNYPKMVEDDQLDVYENIFKPSVETIIKAQLTGICIDMKEVLKVESELSNNISNIDASIRSNPLVIEFNDRLREEALIKHNTTKAKQKTIDDIDEWLFNQNSSVQLSRLLYDKLELPVIDTTETGNPSTGAKTLKKLLDVISNEGDIKQLVSDIIDNGSVQIILSTFIPAFKSAYKANDGKHYLFGNFNVTGTVSGRLSSSNP